MRVNVYAEELTDRVTIIEKLIEGQKFTALRFWLALPVTLANGEQARGPFMHSPADDDSAAVTFWGKRDMRPLLRSALALLDQYYGETEGMEALRATIAALPDGALGTVHQPVPPYHADLIPLALNGLDKTIHKARLRGAATPQEGA